MTEERIPAIKLLLPHFASQQKARDGRADPAALGLADLAGKAMKNRRNRARKFRRRT